MDYMKPSRHPMTWVPTVYFAMGLPFVVIAQVSALMYKDLGISDTQIAFWTSLILLPWTLKPLWSPILEMFKTKKHFVIATELFTGIMFVLAALSLPMSNFFTYSIALLGFIAISGSTHDIATDGVYLSVLNPQLQAKYIGWQGAFYNIAKVVSLSGIVYLAGTFEKMYGITQAWMIVVTIYGLIMLIMGFYHIKMLPSGGSATEVKTFKEGVDKLIEVLITFFQKKFIIWHIIFIILYRFAEGFAIKIAPLFFKASFAEGGLGLSNQDVGLIYGLFGAGAFVLGSILGGNYIASNGLKKSLFRIALIFNLPFVVYTVLAYLQPENFYLISVAVFIEYFGYGFGFVGLTLFMMQQIAPGKYKMAHYAFASGIMNLGFMIPSSISGFFSDMLGYKMFFTFVLVAIIPALLVAKFVPFKKIENVES